MVTRVHRGVFSARVRHHGGARCSSRLPAYELWAVWREDVSLGRGTLLDASQCVLLTTAQLPTPVVIAGPHRQASTVSAAQAASLCSRCLAAHLRPCRRLQVGPGLVRGQVVAPTPAMARLHHRRAGRQRLRRCLRRLTRTGQGRSTRRNYREHSAMVRVRAPAADVRLGEPQSDYHVSPCQSRVVPVSVHHVSPCLRTAGYHKFSLATTAMIIRMFDTSHHSVLTFAQFEALCGYLNAWRDMFRKADSDGSGAISYAELQGTLKGMGYVLSPTTLARMWLVYDEDKSGSLQFDEYIMVSFTQCW